MAKTCNLTKFTALTNEDEAITMLERMRWPDGVVCPVAAARNPTG